jgi:hypothetical protein
LKVLKSIMNINYVESKPVIIPIVDKGEGTRYGKHRPLHNPSQELRGRLMTITYSRQRVKYAKVIPCPLAIEDTLNIGLEKIRKALLDNKLSLSDVVNVTVNHSIGHEACKAIVRRAVAARS